MLRSTISWVFREHNTTFCVNAFNADYAIYHTFKMHILNVTITQEYVMFLCYVMAMVRNVSKIQSS